MFGSLRKPFVVLLAEVSDHQMIADLHGLCFARGWEGSEIAKLARQPSVTMLIARAVGEPKGDILGFNIVRQSQEEAEILSIAVHPRARGRGLGESLMREAILRLRADRIGALILEVDAGNGPAVQLYRRLGFDTVANRPGYYRTAGEEGEAQRSTALVMRLELG